MKEHFKRIHEPLHLFNKQAMLTLIIIEVAIGITAWQMAGGGLVPSPSQILSALGDLLSGPNRNDFLDNLFRSLWISVQGMGISLIITVVVCYLSLIPLFNPITKFLVKSRYLTLTGLIFVIILITDDGSQRKLSLLVLGIVPFFVTSLMSIIDSINTQEYELCKTLRMSSWETLWEVVIIGRLDQVIEVMRQNFAISWMMITMVEGYNMSGGGLGTMLIKYNKFLALDKVFAVMLVIFILGIFFDFILGQVRHWLFPYTTLQVRK